MATEKAILAGGCFWGVQDLVRKLPGVISTRVGYTGGDVANATYRNHGGHAEALEIIFDPEQISYRDLLEFFFQIHDPTHAEPAGQRPRHQLPVGHLLHQRRAEARRRGHHRRRRRLRPVAGQGRHRGDAGRAVLGGRAGAPGLPASTTRTATPATSSARTGSSPTGPTRTRSRLNLPPSAASGPLVSGVADQRQTRPGVQQLPLAVGDDVDLVAADADGRLVVEGVDREVEPGRGLLGPGRPAGKCGEFRCGLRYQSNSPNGGRGCVSRGSAGRRARRTPRRCSERFRLKIIDPALTPT